MPRNSSTHAAGVVITANPVCSYVPLSCNDDTIVTQYTMTTIEELGLLKMDFLGLRNLTVIDDAEKEIRKIDPDFSIKTIPDDDAATFAMLSEGKTQGVFQLESAGMTGVGINMKEALEVSPRLKEMYEGDERVKNIIENERRIESMARTA